jgi:hypothetical protein
MDLIARQKERQDNHCQEGPQEWKMMLDGFPVAQLGCFFAARLGGNSAPHCDHSISQDPDLPLTKWAVTGAMRCADFKHSDYPKSVCPCIPITNQLQAVF